MRRHCNFNWKLEWMSVTATDCRLPFMTVTSMQTDAIIIINAAGVHLR